MPTDASADNPFASRCVRPGAMTFIYPPGLSAQRLVQQLAQQDWRGAIVGGHGSGKSTLLAELFAEAQRAGRQPWHVVLQAGHRRLPLPLEAIAACGPSGLLLIDGYEQLGRWYRWRLARHCRRAGVGQLVTTHAPCELPTLLVLEPTLELFLQIVQQLARGQALPFERQDIEAAYAQANGNLRDALFALYDLFEERRAARPASTGGDEHLSPA
ncbi:MAG: hypothetical protein K6T86_12145 [Pirellulales bacterium]|nr:hypothetical protein [Pirellulales bacterium]